MYYSFFIEVCISIIDDRLCTNLSEKLGCTDPAFAGTEYKHLFSL